jgi:RNA polymerase sigma-70 factor (ECF subfamily)
VASDQQFEAVLAAYQNKVFRLCYAMLGDRAAAEETAQEVFLRIWKALSGYRGESSMSTWIYAIARNACLTALKGRAGKRAISLDDPGVRAAAERRAGGLPTPDHRPDVLRLVGELPENYRQAVLLYHMEERSYEEVAAMLDLPLGTVKTWLHRARRQMAAELVKEQS